ncbi:MAG TPA: hypothetical protein V6C97_15420 [Oculatellaceae cyanobacterium]
MTDLFVIFSMNENGVFAQPAHVNSALRDAMSSPPFSFEDVFIYSHGWWTVADDAMDLYSRYVVEFSKNLSLIEEQLVRRPQQSFGFGIHWPSTVSEDMNSFLQEAEQAASYFIMGARAEQVGSTGLYAALSLMIQRRLASPNPVPLRLTLLGHSFGCRVVCSALQRMATELGKTTAQPNVRDFVQNLQIRAVLLEPAFKNVELDVGGNYSSLATSFPNLKVLITTSQLDYALNHYFPLSEELNNIANLLKPVAVALGAGMPNPPPAPNVTPMPPVLTQSGVVAQAPGGGPTLTTWQAFGGQGLVTPLRITPGFKPTDFSLPQPQRIAVADLTAVHMANLMPTQSSDDLAAAEGPEWMWNKFSGSHSDILCPEIFNLIAGFVFNA